MPVVYVDTIDLPDSTAVNKAECLMVGIIPRSLVVGKQQDIFLTGERCIRVACSLFTANGFSTITCMPLGAQALPHEDGRRSARIR